MFSNETTPQIYINEGGRSSLVKSKLNNNQSPPPPSTPLNLTVLLDYQHGTASRDQTDDLFRYQEYDRDD